MFNICLFKECRLNPPYQRRVNLYRYNFIVYGTSVCYLTFVVVVERGTGKRSEESFGRGAMNQTITFLVFFIGILEFYQSYVCLTEPETFITEISDNFFPAVLFRQREDGRNDFIRAFVTLSAMSGLLKFFFATQTRKTYTSWSAFLLSLSYEIVFYGSYAFEQRFMFAGSEQKGNASYTQYAYFLLDVLFGERGFYAMCRVGFSPLVFLLVLTLTDPNEEARFQQNKLGKEIQKREYKRWYKEEKVKAQ
jgi:hypothetical protein